MRRAHHDALNDGLPSDASEPFGHGVDQKLLFLFIAVIEPFDATFGIEKFVLAGEKRMAIGTNFDSDFGFGRAGFKLISAGAVHLGLYIDGMNTLFHKSSFLLKSPLKLNYPFDPRLSI